MELNSNPIDYSRAQLQRIMDAIEILAHADYDRNRQGMYTNITWDTLLPSERDRRLNAKASDAWALERAGMLKNPGEIVIVPALVIEEDATGE